MNKTINFLVKEKESGMRIDVYLSKKINTFTRSYIKKLIEEKNLRVNNSIKNAPATRIKINDKISLNFSFLGSEINGVVKDSFGYLFQSWLVKWFNDNDIYSRENKNSQEPPDFYIKKDSDTSGFLEIKTFYQNPNFDIHGWDAYLNLLIDKPYHIDADFMIFNYDVSSQGDYFTIKNIYVKKIWEISRKMTRNSRPVQNLVWSD